MTYVHHCNVTEIVRFLLMLAHLSESYSCTVSVYMQSKMCIIITRPSKGVGGGVTYVPSLKFEKCGRFAF